MIAGSYAIRVLCGSYCVMCFPYDHRVYSGKAGIRACTNIINTDSTANNNIPTLRDDIFEKADIFLRGSLSKYKPDINPIIGGLTI